MDGLFEENFHLARKCAQIKSAMNAVETYKKEKICFSLGGRCECFFNKRRCNIFRELRLIKEIQDALD